MWHVIVSNEFLAKLGFILPRGLCAILLSVSQCAV